MMLKSCGRVLTTGDEITNLFWESQMVKDEVFRDHMEHKKEHYKENDRITLTINKLILFDQNKYNKRT